jgi:hypothetical protein
MASGPDPNFVEPGGLMAEPAFFMARPEGPFSEGNPVDCARRKAALFGEGGPAILEVEIPVAILATSLDLVAEVVFGPGYGLEELRAAWPTLAKNIDLLDE